MSNRARSTAGGGSDSPTPPPGANALPAAAATLYRVIAGLAEHERSAIIDHLPELERRFLDRLARLSAAQTDDSLDAMLAQLVRELSTAVLADRSTLFLYDPDSQELFSRVAEGTRSVELRFDRDAGIAGRVFVNEEPSLVNDVSRDPRFNAGIDAITGYQTHSALTVPVRLPQGQVIGVAQALNHEAGAFTLADQVLLESLVMQIAPALRLAHRSDTFEREQRAHGRLLQITEEVAREADSEVLLTRIVSAASDVVNADRTTLFLYDPESDELYSRVAEGIHDREIRIPAASGLAGHVFHSGQSANVASADTDPRFNNRIDSLAGYATHSVLAVPILGRQGTPLGVLQSLNRRSGRFTLSDQIRLETLATQTALVLEHMALLSQSARARRFADNILESVSSAVVTLDHDLHVTSLNTAAERLFAAPLAQSTPLRLTGLFQTPPRPLELLIERVIQRCEPDTLKYFAVSTPDGRELRVNVQVSPFAAADGAQLGAVLVFEDVSREVHLEQTLRRYLPIPARHPALTESQTLGGEARHATVLFSDIAGFTKIAEQLGASATVDWLNCYFALMGEVVEQHGGHIDKFIGDAVMAVFGMHESAPDDADRALRCALTMQQRLTALNAQLRATGQPTMSIRVGINTDEVLIGNIGSADRMSYTVVGDGANVASRLESANKFYDSGILLSKGTLDALKSPAAFLIRPLDTVRVRGRATPVDILELLGVREIAPAESGAEALAGEADALTHDLAARYAAGLLRLRENRALEAYVVFSELVEVYPEDVPSRMMLKRACTALAEGTCEPFLINDLTGQ